MEENTHEETEQRNPVKEVRDALSAQRKVFVRQVDIADEIGCTERTIQRCEDEKRLPTQTAALRNLVRLAEKANINLEGVLDVDSVMGRRKRRVSTTKKTSAKTLVGA